MNRSTALLSALSTTFLLIACSGADPSASTDQGSTAEAISDDGVEPGMKVHWQKGAAPTASSSGGNLIDHGGRVLPASKVYTFWWGDQAGFPSDAKAGIDSLFQGLSGTSFLGIANQYMRGASTTSSFVASYTDTSAPPKRAPSTATIVNEACSVINANGLSADPAALYVVYTSNFAGHTSYCAWHSSGTCNGQTIQVAYMPNTTGMAGCDPGDLYGCNSYSQGTRSLANVTSHEFMEAITDADPGSSTGAWTDSSGSEIGDKCAWTFSSCVNLKNGNWQLQKEWSNAISGCQQQ